MRLRHNTTPYQGRKTIEAGCATGSYTSGREAAAYTRLQAHHATGSRGAHADRVQGLIVLAVVTLLVIAALVVAALV